MVTLDGGTSITTGNQGLIAGAFTFSVVETGLHTLVETNPAGYRSTTPDQVNVPITVLDGSYYVGFGDTKARVPHVDAARRVKERPLGLSGWLGLAF